LFLGHPRDIGILGTFATEEAAELLVDVDCVLAVGASLNPYQTGGGGLAGDARVIQIDSDAKRIGALARVALGVVGDAALTVRAISQAIDRADVPIQTPWTTEPFEARVKAAVSASRSAPVSTSSETPLMPSRVLAALDGSLPSERFVAVDGGWFMYSVVRHIKVSGPRSWLWTLDFKAIGLGLGMALGAALARPDERCVLFVGDGGLAMSLQELETLVREDIPLTVVVMNNAAHAGETRLLLAEGKPPTLTEFKAVDFAGVASALGAKALTVRTTDDLDLACEMVATSTGPLVIDVRVGDGGRYM
jgi:thiamine pyrophosphate-dependent acetolactate synthase large subunit-like protein